MTRPLKVYGGLKFFGGKQVRVFVAASSWAQAADAVGLKLSHIRGFWSITGNEGEIALALKTPGVMCRSPAK